MFGFIKKLFGSTPVETVAEAPYKVETVAPVATVAEKASEAVVKSIASPAPKKRYYSKKKASSKPAGAAKSASKTPKAKPTV